MLKTTAYYNSIQRLHKIYDGLLFYDRSGELRTEVDGNSIAVGTEIFTALLGKAPQDATDHQRWWEINGTSLSLTERTDLNGPCSPSPIYNQAPNSDVIKAALHSLNDWIVSGAVPATAPRFFVDEGTPLSAPVPSSLPISSDPEAVAERSHWSRSASPLRLSSGAPIGTYVGQHFGWQATYIEDALELEGHTHIQPCAVPFRRSRTLVGCCDGQIDLAQLSLHFGRLHS